MGSAIAAQQVTATLIQDASVIFFNEPVVIHNIIFSASGTRLITIADKDGNNIISPRTLILDSSGDQYVAFNIPALYENGLQITNGSSGDLFVSVLHEFPGGG